MFLLCRLVFCLILSLIFALRYVKGNSGYAVQWYFGFSNYNSLDSLQCEETELPLCSKMCFSEGGNSGPHCLHNMSVMANGYLTCYIDPILPAAGLYHLNVTVTNSIYTHSASWKIRACPFGTEYLKLMLSKRDRDIPSCAPLPTDAEDKQQGKASTKSMDSHKRAVWIFSDKRAYATETDIEFVAVTEGPDPLYIYW